MREANKRTCHPRYTVKVWKNKIEEKMKEMKKIMKQMIEMININHEDLKRRREVKWEIEKLQLVNRIKS